MDKYIIKTPTNYEEIDGAESEVNLGTPNTELRMIYKNQGTTDFCSAVP